MNYKTFGSIPIGNVELISKNIPADLRTFELSYLFYKAYNIAGWWVINKSNGSFGPPSHILNDNRYSNLYIIKDYKYGCTTQIYLKNSLRKYQRIKQFYVFKYKFMVAFYMSKHIINIFSLFFCACVKSPIFMVVRDVF